MSARYKDLPFMDAQQEYRRDLKVSINVVLITMFLSSIGFTISLPSLWLYYANFPECQCKHAKAHAELAIAREVDPIAINASAFVFATREEFWLHYAQAAAQHRNSCKVSEDDADLKTCKKKRACERYSGIIVAAFPFAQLVFSPLLGLWGTHRPVKEVLVFSLLVLMSGYSLYAMATTGSFLTLARFLMGIGASNASVLRFYASGATEDHERTKIMAWISGAQALGYVVGPAVGFLLAALLKEHAFYVIPGNPNFRVDEYTSPGWAAAIFTVLNIVAVVVGMKELAPEPGVQPMPLGGSRPPTLNIPGIEGVPRSVPDVDIDWRPTSVLILFFMVIQMVFSIYEGVGTQVSQCALGWGVRQNGVFLAVMAVLAVAVVAALGRQQSLGGVSELNVMVGSYVLLMASLVVLMDFVPPLTLPQWIVGGILLSGSFPVSQAMVWVLFSRVVPRRFQGLLMGYLISAGSLSRMFGPPIATWAYSAAQFRTSPLFLASAAAMAVPLCLCVAYWELLRQQNSPITPAPTPVHLSGEDESDLDTEESPLLGSGAGRGGALMGAMPRHPSPPRTSPPRIPAAPSREDCI